MNYQWLDSYLMALPGVIKDFKEEWQWDRYLLDDKLICAITYDSTHSARYITLKLKPEHGEALRMTHHDIIPGYYMNKKHWNSINVSGNITDDHLKELLSESYQLVFSSFSKKKQAKILDAK